jgi:hypothetical protein
MNGFGPVSRFADRLSLMRAVVQKPGVLDALLQAMETGVASPVAAS